ncbi:MAG: helix-turn-helix domain-containing protein [Beijerinckiaceae bacterium]|nr:helix-turn-helix domain-containing protein [Beijerinckiaceae bacterium]
MTHSPRIVEPLAYNITDAARALGISRQALYNHIASKKIKKIKIGRRSFISREEIARVATYGTEPEA